MANSPCDKHFEGRVICVKTLDSLEVKAIKSLYNFKKCPICKWYIGIKKI